MLIRFQQAKATAQPLTLQSVPTSWPPLTSWPPRFLQLLFRDNLGEVLAAAVPGERQMEAKLRQWLQRCHTTLDKSVRFEALADSHTQVQ